MGGLVPNNPLRVKDDATADELRAKVMRHIARLSDAGVIDLTALPMPDGGTANRSVGAIDPCSKCVNECHAAQCGSAE